LGDFFQSRAKTLRVAVDERNTKVAFRPKVIVNTCLANPKFVRNVLVAERVIPARLDQRLGKIENVVDRVRTDACDPDTLALLVSSPANALV
jgi:hypothetical protein